MTGKGVRGPRLSGATEAIPAVDAGQDPPTRVRLLAAVLDAVGRLREQRLPWSVVATNLCVEDDKGRLRVDLVARFDPRPVFVAMHCVSGAVPWWFSRHPQCGQQASRSVFVDEYVIKEGGVQQRPVRLGYGRPEPFRLATVEGDAVEVRDRADPVDVALDALRAQDAVAQKWLPGHLGANRAGGKGIGVSLVSVILTDRALRQHPALKPADHGPGTSSGGPSVGELEWLWLECGLMRPALVLPQGADGQLPYGYDSLFTRDVAVARAGSLDALLMSEGWPDSFY